MSSDYYWMAYKALYNAPGMPNDLRCVGCKYTTGAALLAVGGAMGYKTYQIINHRPYVGMGLAFATLFSLFGAAVSFRLGYDDSMYNRQRIKEHAAEIKRKRREGSGPQKRTDI